MQYADPVLDEIEATFRHFDQNDNQSIEFDEFAGLMLRMDHTRSSSALRLQFDAIDTNHDGRLSFLEFRTWCDIGR